MEYSVLPADQRSTSSKRHMEATNTTAARRAMQGAVPLGRRRADLHDRPLLAGATVTGVVDIAEKASPRLGEPWLLKVGVQELIVRGAGRRHLPLCREGVESVTTEAGEAVGVVCRYRAVTPAVRGVAMEVPRNVGVDLTARAMLLALWHGTRLRPTGAAGP